MSDETIHNDGTSSSVIDRASTPAEEQALSTARERLAAMVGTTKSGSSVIDNARHAANTPATGPPPPPYTPTTGSQARIDAIRKDPEFYRAGTTKQKALAAEMHKLMSGAPDVARQGETDNQAKIRALNESGRLTSPDPTVRAAAMKELRQHLAAESTEDERNAMGDAPIGVLREQFNVDHSKVMPSLRNAWDEDAEGDILGAMAIRGVEPKAAAALHDWWCDQFNGAVGRVENLNPATLETDFRARATKAGLPADLINNIVKAERERLGL
jgi:hypothetical protein